MKKMFGLSGRTVFEWPELNGKVLKITVGKDNDFLLVTGTDVVDGITYVLAEEFNKAADGEMK